MEMWLSCFATVTTKTPGSSHRALATLSPTVCSGLWSKLFSLNKTSKSSKTHHFCDPKTQWAQTEVLLYLRSMHHVAVWDASNLPELNHFVAHPVAELRSIGIQVLEPPQTRWIPDKKRLEDNVPCWCYVECGWNIYIYIHMRLHLLIDSLSFHNKSWSL